ncbi:MAG: phage integrase N-terminal SAM-like domain-containing protein [Nitrospiria bacterium]
MFPYKNQRKILPKSARLIDQVRETLRYHHYSLRTEKTYVQWIVRFDKALSHQHTVERVMMIKWKP